MLRTVHGVRRCSHQLTVSAAEPYVPRRLFDERASEFRESISEQTPTWLCSLRTSSNRSVSVDALGCVCTHYGRSCYTNRLLDALPRCGECTNALRV